MAKGTNSGKTNASRGATANLSSASNKGSASANANANSNARSSFPAPPHAAGHGQWTAANTRTANEMVSAAGYKDANYWAMNQKTGISTKDLRDNYKPSSNGSDKTHGK